MTEFWIGFAIGGGAFGTLGWFCKDWILRQCKGPAKFVSDLEDQVRDLRQRLR